MDPVPARVLLIEDNEADYHLTRRMLHSLDGYSFDLEWANSFENGLNAIRRNEHDIYLLDYNLGAANGLDLLAELRKMDHSPAAIMLTGMASHRLVVEAMKLGASDYLVKDEMTPALLERSIRFVLQQASTAMQLRRQQEELRVSELRFRCVVQSASDAILICDAAGRIISWNRAAESIFGYGEDEVLGQPLDVLMPSNYRDEQRVEFERFRVTGKSRIVGRMTEVEGLRKDGGTFPAELSLASWSTSEGSFFTAIVRDCSERIRSEEARRAKEAAEEANRAKSACVTKISHEVRTPLSAILGFTNLLLLNQAGEIHGQTRDFLERILVNAKDLLSLINGMLDLSKIESGKLEVENQVVEVDAMIRDVVRQLGGPHRHRGVDVVVHIPDHVAPITSDPAKLKQVLVNLIENALKFTARGCVRVAVETAHSDSTPTRISVTDTGPGIPGDELERIFEPFHQVDGGKTSKYGGTGLGLPICKSLCELLGYSLDVQSAAGSGATFSIVLNADVRRLPRTA